MTRLRKKILCLAAIVFAVFTALGVWTMIAPEKTADAYGTDTQEVQLRDLMDRHGVDYVIGPLAPSGTTYYDKNGDVTNNVYGIEKYRYFDYTNYLRIPQSEPTSLYGWNNDIAPGNTVGTIDTYGKIAGHGNQIYIYENAKYVIVVPDFITTFGTGVYHHRMTDGNGNTHENITVDANSTYNYTSFSTYHYYETGSPASWDWQPRERLAGIYCGPDSQLTTINGISGVSLNATTGNLTGAPANRPETTNNGAKTYRPLLYYCDNMRFCILPNGLNTIGNLAFGHCQQLRDVNIPSNSVDVGNFAFAYCSVMPHITIPSGTTLGTNVFYNCNNLRDVENNTNYAASNFPARMNSYTSSSGKSQLFAIGTKDGDTGTQAFYYCYNSVLGNSTALATTNGSTQMAGYATGWYVIGLAGLEDKNKQTLYEMPATVSGDNDVRRADIKYDYINPDRTIHKNKFSENTNANNQKITVYNISKNAISETWCGNLIIPSTVTTIGDNAFYYTHMQYLEIGSGVKYIGYQAFYHNASNMDVNGVAVFNRRQYYYIHNNTAQANIGKDAFEAVVNNANRSGAATERWYIFDESTWDTRDYYTNGNMESVLKKKQIPVYAEVESNDGRVEVNGDMETRFRHDSDVVSGAYKQYSANGTTYQQVTDATNGNGTYKITYTKRLEGHLHNFVKDSRGLWINATDGIANGTASNSLPTITGYKTTNWYANKAGTGNKLANLGPIYPTSVSAAGTIYSQKVAKPSDITPNDWTYSEDMNENDHSFNKLLNLSNEFKVSLTKYTDPWQDTNASRPYVNAAGEYEFSIQLNPEKWGEWTDDSPLTATVYVNQKEIDLGQFENVPKFWARGTSVQNALSGNKTPVYEYSDGYYITKRTGLIEISTETVSNSYAMYTGQEMQIGPENWTLYNVTGDSASRLVATASGRYDASFSFNVKDSNYKFVYGGLEDANQLEIFADNRISYTSTLERSAIITKRWFIVTPFNWLVDVSSAGGAASINNQFVLAEKRNADNSYSAIYEWTYDYNDITVRVNTPKLANGHADGILSASVLRNGTLIEENIDVANLAYYINDSMPAGEYTVIISAKEVENYGAFDTVFTITVNPKPLEVSAIINYLTGNNAETGKVFEKANDNTLFLYTEGTEWNTIVSTINNSLNSNRKSSGDSYWKEQTQNGYYGDILLKYNLDALQTTAYYDKDGLSPFSAAPKAVGQYLVYYSVSAPNYITVGETDKEGDSRRDYRFTSVIYDLLSASELADKINSGNYVYTSAPVYATVPYSVNYSYSFDDTTDNAYITVDRNHYVTVTINDPLLMRWKDTDGANITVESNTKDAQVITIRYSLTAATNSWQSTPQMTAWSYKGFDSATHKITGTLTFKDAQVYYRLGILVDGKYEWINVGGTAVMTDSSYFTVVNGEVVEENVISVLNTLPVGDYVLASYVQAREDGNVLAYATPSSLYGNVHISKAVNLWTSSPNIIRWTWGEYDETVNLLSATAQFGEADLSEAEINGGIEAPQVTYTILKIVNGNFVLADDALLNFTAVDADVAAALKGLDAGTYYLVATLDERANFRAINSYAIDKGEGVDYNRADKVQFEIRIAQNAWATSPRMTTWQYKQFTDTANFVAGIPTYGTTVTYGIYVGSANLPKTEQKPSGAYTFTTTYVTDAEGNITTQSTISNVKDYLISLGAGNDYWLVAYVDGADNKYAPLYREINFAITQASNSWSQTPAVIGWTYLEFADSLVTEGTAAYGDVLYTVQKLGANSSVTGNVTGAENITYDDLLEVLKDLGVNAVYNEQTQKYTVYGYNLKVTTAESANYSQAPERNIFFNVSRANDSWQANGEPSIKESWTFGTTLEDSDITGGTLQNQTTGAKVTVEYYETTTDRNGQLVVDYNSVPSKTLPQAVGSYARVTTVAESANFNELVHVSFFNITKVPNTWNVRPEMSLSWTWGAYETVIEGSNLIKASAQYPATITYSIYKDEEGYALNISQDDIKGILEKLPAGQYSVRTEVAESDNYDVPDPSYLATTINVAKADFDITTAPSSAVWTWGDTTMPFTEMAVKQVIASDLTKADATIEYSLDGGTIWRTSALMLPDLRGRGVGTYTVNVRVTYPNYNDNTDYSVTVEIRAAAFSWTGDGTSEFGWSWNNTTEPTGKTLPTLTASTTAKDVTGVTVTYVVRQGTTSTDPLDHDALLAYLYDIESIGTYNVTATATTGSATYDANFTVASKTRTFTVEIAKAKNSWTTTPTTKIEFEFVENRTWMTADKLILGVPAFGEVVYYDSNGRLIVNPDNEPLKNETLKAELVRLINALNADTEAYLFDIKVTGNNYYEGLDETLKVTVKGIASSWMNADDIQNYNFTYGSDLSSNMATVVIPELEEIPGSASDATLYYSIKYVNSNGDESTTTYTMGIGDVTFANIIGHVKAYLTDSSRGAGTYTVTAVYNPHTNNYAELNTPFTIIVEKFTVDWTDETKDLESEYIFELGNAAGITPVTNAADAGIDVPVKYSVDGVETEISDLTAYVNGLAIGSYRIEYSVIGTNNYTGLSAGQMRVVITKAANRWEIIDRQAVWEFRRGEDIAITVPVALHGNNSYKIGEGSEFTPSDEEFDFNAYLYGNNYAAGDYVITIRVIETPAYYGTEAYTFTLRILKKDNEWVKAPQTSMTKVGSLTVSDFAIPQAKEANGLLRFDISKAGGGAQYGLDVIMFKTAIPELTDGTYTITMRVGGTGTGYTDSDQTTLNAYNADYNPLVATTVVTVTRAQLMFSTHLAVPDWAYNDRLTADKNVTRPVFAIDESVTGTLSEEEKDNITTGISIAYSIIGNNVDITGKTYAEFLLAFKDLEPGTYSATASIATTKTYIGVSETVAFTVSKNTTVWANADELINMLTWTYGDVTASQNLKTPKLASGDGRSVKYTLWSGSNVTEVISGTNWDAKLRTLGAGTYIFSASVDGDTFNTSAEYLATVTVERATREWDVHPSDTQISWTYHDTVNNEKIEFEYEIPLDDEKDENGNAKAELIIYVDNVRLVLASGETLANKLAATLSSLAYGTHSITATVAQTIYYGSLTETVTLSVARAENKWFTDNTDTYAMKLKNEWTWLTPVTEASLGDLNWQSPIPDNGNSAVITVYRYDSDTELSLIFTTTFSYTNHQASDDSGLKYRLRGLDAGKYKITAQVPQDDCYNELTRSIDFTVKKADNTWTQAPSINTSGVLSIRFFPKYGDYRNVVVYFAQKDTPNDWSTQLPVAKGDYLVKGYLAGTDNYNEINDSTPSSSFSLEKENNGWTVMPGVNGWEWNAFDKNENIFRGTAISNGTVTFRIELAENDSSTLKPANFSEEFAEKYSQADITRILYGGTNGGFVLDANGLVSDEVEALLKLLLPKDQYKLVVIADGDENYQIFSTDVYFNVTKATNVWNDYPNIDSFVYGGTISFTAGVTKFGDSEGKDVLYQIVDTSNEVVKGYALFDYDKPEEFFKGLNIGTYVLQIWVPEGDTYGNLYDEDTPYPKVFYVTGAVNSWTQEATTSISKYWSELQAVTNIRNLFAAPVAKEGTPVYTVLTTSYSPVNGGATYKYSELLAGLKTLGSGDYILRITLDKDSLNNYGNLTADVSLSIMRYTTNFVNLPDSFSGQWQRDASGNTATVINTPAQLVSARYGEADAKGVVTAQKGTIGESTVTYTFASTEHSSWDDLKASGAVKALDAGSYQVVVSISATNVYSAISTTVQLNVAQGTNEWKNNWDVEISILASDGKAAGSSWKYGSAISWKNATPKYGEIVYVEIRRDGASEALSYITINYKATEGVDNAIASVAQDLSKLGAGNYEFTVSSPADKNWGAISSTTKFRITQVENDWVIGPQMKYSADNRWVYGDKWTYGSAALPEATAKYGTDAITYKYYVYGSTDELEGMPVNAGKYTVVFSIKETVNYKPLNASVDFEIEKATDRSFIVSSGTTGWTWNSFNRLTNLFKGIPNTRGAVSYTILYNNSVVVVDGIKLENIPLVDSLGVHTGDPDKDLYVPELYKGVRYAELINKLNANDISNLEDRYVLRINVGETSNYISFTSDSPFAISPAANEWLTIPGIVSWSIGETVNTPHAESLYGHPEIIIKSKLNGDVYYSRTYNDKTQDYDIDDKLALAPAGWYIMETTVEGVEGQYNGLSPDPIEFQVFIIGTSEDRNIWVIDGNISGWTATYDINEIVMPVGTPLRGLPYFVFKDSTGKEITAGDNVFKIEAGDTYFKDFYIPMLPGTYSMVAYADRYDLSGNIVDHIWSETVWFEISSRENSWVNDPRIANVLYLGEKTEWADPVAAASTLAEDNEITVLYLDKNTGLPILDEETGLPIGKIPTKKGQYTLFVTATATLYKTIEYTADFRVEYSYNAWISAPTVESYTEEYGPNTAVAEAVYGTDRIVYTYAPQDKPNDIHEGLPTEEGEYIVYANIYCEEDGYADIEAKFTLSVGPAFDNDLLIVDIVLGSVGSVLTIVVIYLAIKKRRYL